ncbi:MAG: serine hydrolase, partial [Cyanobacteria bacterium P01_D01_bin.128]
HGLWIEQEPRGEPEIYLMGCDAGVSCWSSVRRKIDRQVTVLSNTTEGAWPLLRDIDNALES